MIYLKSAEEIAIIKESAEILGKVHGEIAKNIKKGVSTDVLDRIAEEFIRDHGGTPSFKGYNGFPYTLCVSLNENVVHGFPSKKPLDEGDIVSVDCGVFYKGFHSDSAYTHRIGTINTQTEKLLQVTEECLYKGIEQAIAGNRIGDIAFAVQQHAENNGFSVVRELVGHGVGKRLHEAPEVPNYGKRGKGVLLQEGMVLAIEPMINLGKRSVVQESDGWTIRTQDRLPSAHYEHTVVVRKNKAEVLTTFEYIKEALKQ
ncbi:type I methionyl aminopeptidase [Cytophagales bacterium LB-30]|uniref:Methionine aminopeptidase n=1 Tax=Shiella aurantiaca TaxID=3058365 RepID=A0ABT8F778_9BACT|nr:type I methionyl aminopeptidase [Shiella aurantiaca]MDN4166315.1 type I methionyl aminopeptidase [Shiella aurantiaca]